MKHSKYSWLQTTRYQFSAILASMETSVNSFCKGGVSDVDHLSPPFSYPPTYSFLLVTHPLFLPSPCTCICTVDMLMICMKDNLCKNTI